MKTAEERVAALHDRMRARFRKRERRRTTAIGTACAGLAACLLLVMMEQGSHGGATAGLYSGATMLFEDAGGYVLTALAAFMIGVIITVIIRNRLKKKPKDREN